MSMGEDEEDDEKVFYLVALEHFYGLMCFGGTSRGLIKNPRASCHVYLER